MSITTAPPRKRTTQPSLNGAGVARLLLRILVGSAALLSLFPVGVSLGQDVGAPHWAELVATWSVGTPLTALVALLIVLLVPHSLQLSPSRLPALDTRATLALAALLCLVAFALYAWVARTVFGGFPLHIDELTQAVQARTFLNGRLWSATPLDPEFTSALLIVDQEGRRFAQFPPGWSLVLAFGDLLHARWLMGPLAGALALAAFLLLCRALGESDGFALLAGLVFLLCPWLIFTAATMMNHTATMGWLLLGSALLVFSTRTDRSGLAAVAGLCFGLAATMRPLDAACFALPALVWLSARARDTRSPREVAALLAGLALPLAGLFAYNTLTTGAPFRFGYEALWGATHGLGFHEAPWGPAHTPARGLALLNKYLLRAQEVLFNAPVPVLLLPLSAVLLARKLAPADRYLAASATLLGTGYLLYWHDGEYLGPRFLLPLAPVLLLWTMRLPRIIAARTNHVLAARWAAAWIAVIVAAGLLRTPAQARAYSDSFAARRIDVRGALRAADVSAGLVFVPSAWSAQLAPRLWSLGIGRRAAQRLLDAASPCTLEELLALVPQEQLRGESLLARLSQDAAQRPAAATTPTCRARAKAEQAGTWSLLPFLAARAEGTVFVRDLHERNEALLRRFSGPYYVVRPDARHGLARPRIVPFDLDSARWEWNVTNRGTPF